MADFKPINTPEELEAAIAPYKEKAAKYDAGKNLERQIKDLEGQLSAANNTIAENAKTVAALTARAENAEAAILRAKVANANNLPYEMAERLNGATEEELTADAKELAKLLAPPAVAPLASTEGSSAASGMDAAFLNLAQQL